MRFISAGVYVGDMVLQQLAQLRQSTSCHTALSAASVAAPNFLGEVFSNTVRNLRNLLLLCLALDLNDRRLICCMLYNSVRKYDLMHS
jgi:hypothetical protein